MWGKYVLLIMILIIRKKPTSFTPFDLLSLEDGYDVKMILKQISGRDTFPNTFLNGQTLGGSDDLERLHETGQLQALLSDNQLLL